MQERFIKNIRKKPDTHETERFRKDTKLRIYLAWVVTVLICAYIVFACVLICIERPLSDVVMITFLSTTTVNILGLMYIILKGMFKI